MSTRDLAQLAYTAGVLFTGSLVLTLAGVSRWHTSTVILGAAFGALSMAALESYGRDLSRQHAKEVWKK